MLNYNDTDIKNMLKGILDLDGFIVEPIGNHHLKRHLVYKILLPNEEKLIFKLYYIKNRRGKELSSLKLLSASEIKCPRIIKYGCTDGVEWVILTYLDGELFDKVLPSMTREEAANSFYQIGEELGRLHSFKAFDFFGEWDEDGKPLLSQQDYISNLILKTEAFYEDIKKKPLPDKEVLFKAIDELRANFEKLNIKTIPRLTHGDFDGRNILVTGGSGSNKISGIIDFEMCYPWNSEMDFIGLYFRYFLENKDYEEAFFRGYKKFMQVNEGFNERLYVYLLRFSVGNCSWSYPRAREYYKANIKLLTRLLSH